MKGFEPGRRLQVRPAPYLWLLPALLLAAAIAFGAADQLWWAAAFLLAAAWPAWYLARDLVDVTPEGMLCRRGMIHTRCVDLTDLSEVVARTVRGKALPSAGTTKAKVVGATLIDGSGRRVRIDGVLGEPQPAFSAILHYARLPGTTVEVSDRSAAFLDAGAVGRHPE